MAVNRGKFIVVEGLEGAGKSTAMHTIKRFLGSLVPEMLSTREPGGTKIGEEVRKLIKDKDILLDGRAELLLMYAARVQLVEEVIKPALNRGCWVIADRFELSSFAYQGGGRKLDKTFIDHLSAFCLGSFKPDLTIFLDISPKLGLKRASMRGKTDRIEQESLTFFNDVWHAYQAGIQKMPNVVTVDASKPLFVVQQTLCTVLQHFMSQADVT